MIIDLKVIPASGKQFCKLDKNGTLKCYLKNPAEKGKANDELCTLFARLLDIPRANVVIVSGATVPRKKLRITTSLTYKEILSHLGIDYQTSFTIL